MCSAKTQSRCDGPEIELTAAMDWYARCIVGLRLTPVSTKAVDAIDGSALIVWRQLVVSLTICPEKRWSKRYALFEHFAG